MRRFCCSSLRRDGRAARRHVGRGLGTRVKALDVRAAAGTIIDAFFPKLLPHNPDCRSEQSRPQLGCAKAGGAGGLCAVSAMGSSRHEVIFSEQSHGHEERAVKVSAMVDVCHRVQEGGPAARVNGAGKRHQSEGMDAAAQLPKGAQV